MTRLAWLASWIALEAAPVAAVGDLGSVGLTWDPHGEVCNLQIAVGGEACLYVFAHPTGAFGGGITGSEFRVSDFPSDWQITGVTPNPEAAFSLGDPLGAGCNIGFSTCQFGYSGPVLLYTVCFVAMSPVHGRVLEVEGHATPSNPLFPCPRLIACDGADIWACSTGGTAAINAPQHCTTGLEAISWSALRSLYR